MTGPTAECDLPVWPFLFFCVLCVYSVLAYSYGFISTIYYSSTIDSYFEKQGFEFISPLSSFSRVSLISALVSAQSRMRTEPKPEAAPLTRHAPRNGLHE